MKLLLQISMCCLLAGSAMARSGGGGGGRGGGGGGISRGGGGFSHGGFGGVYGGLGYGRGYGGYGYGGYGYGRGYGYGLYGYGYGLGFGYWPYAYDPYYYGDPYDYGAYGGGYASYQTSPNVTVIYPQQTAQAAPPPPPERANPVIREYDQYGQEVRPGAATAGGSPVYLIAFNDHVIRAAAAYWVDGKTLHYVTLQHEEKQASLDTVDRSLSVQLNRERQVPFQLPVQ